MCGQIEVKYDPKDLVQRFTPTRVPSTWRSGTIGFGKLVTILRPDTDTSSGVLFENQIWGTSIAPTFRDTNPQPIFNARIESVTERQMFHEAVEKQNFCIIPTSGFYEHGYLFVPKNDAVLFLAGLCLEDGSFVVFTQEARKMLKPIHGREPISIRSDAVHNWLRPIKGKVLPCGEFQLHSVSPMARRVTNGFVPL